MRTVLLVALVAVPVAVFAQASDPVERLAVVLSLTTDQADLAAEVYDVRSPSSVWTLAAELVPTLEDRQRAALMARPERAERPGRGVGAGRPGRDGQPPRRREPDPAQQAVTRAARDAALRLDARQSSELDAALEALSPRDRMQAMRDGDLPASVADVLTAEQADLYRAQLALQRLLRRGGRPGADR